MISSAPRPRSVFSRNWLRAVLIALFTWSAAAAPARSYDEFVLLVDTSRSMQDNDRIGQLKIALINYTNTLPVERETRVWVFGFDADLHRIADGIVLDDTDKLSRLQLALNAIPKPVGSNTRTWPALNGVFDALAAAQTKDTSRSVSIHVFTDGDADKTKVTFGNILQRLAALRSRNQEWRLYFHVLDCEPPPEIKAAAVRSDSGVYLVQGMAMPPQIIPDRVRPSDSALMSGTPQRWVGVTVGVAENWLWEFGDATTSTEVSPTHVFARSGEYVVTVRASNKAGNDVRKFPVQVGSRPPTAAFESSGAYAGAEIILRDVSTGEVTARKWNLDGEAAGSDPEWRHVFPAAGIHKMSLTVTGPGGSGTKTGELRILPPTAVAFSWTPDRPLRGQEVAFINEATNLSPPWQWDFGDGATSTERNPKHAFASAGRYAVTLTGLSPEGQSLRGNRTVEVVVLPPHASFAIAGTTGQPVALVGQPLELRDTSTGTIETRQWDLGDSRQTSGLEVAPTYAQAGTFTITLTVRGPGGTDLASRTVTIAEPGWKLVARPQPAWLGETVTFALENPPPNLRSLQWDFGDKTPAETRATGNTAEHSYHAEGVFKVSVGAMLQSGEAAPLRRTIATSVTVQSDTVSLDFSVTGTRAIGAPDGRARWLRGPVPLAVKIVNRCRGPVRTFSWNFGDGTSSDDQAPAHIYRSPGSYSVTLQVVDQRDRKFATTTSQRFIVEATGWRPPKSWYWPTWGGCILLLGLLWWVSPFGYRKIGYRLPDGRSRTYKNWTKDLVLQNQGQSARFRLARSAWLRKRYTVVLGKGARWLDRNDQAVLNRTARRGDVIVLGEDRYALTGLNSSPGTSVRSILCLLVLVGAAAWLARNFFV